MLGLKMLSLGVLFLRKISEYIDCKNQSHPSFMKEALFGMEKEPSAVTEVTF